MESTQAEATVVAQENNSLVFISTIHLGDFKDAQGVGTIDILRNPETGKMFFAAGATTGAVSKRLDTNEDIYVSLVRGDDGAEFYLMHNRGAEIEVVAKV
jgi:hypothetical protein